jgi:hypothetical protein
VSESCPHLLWKKLGEESTRRRYYPCAHFPNTSLKLTSVMEKYETQLIQKMTRVQKNVAQQTIAVPSVSVTVIQESTTPGQPSPPSDPDFRRSYAPDSKPKGASNTLIVGFLRESISYFRGALPQLPWLQTGNSVSCDFSYKSKSEKLKSREQIRPISNLGDSISLVSESGLQRNSRSRKDDMGLQRLSSYPCTRGSFRSFTILISGKTHGLSKKIWA